MAERELTIKLKLDRSQAAAAAQADVAAQAQVVAAHKRAGDAIEAGDRAVAAAKKQLVARELSDVQVAEQAKSKLIRAANDQRIKAAEQAAQADAKGMGLAQRAAGSLAGAVSSLGGAYLGLQGARKILEGIGEASMAAARNQKGLADEFIRQRDALREIRVLEGGKTDIASTVGAAQYEVKTGFRPEEARAFKTQVLNSGAQYEGLRIQKGAEFQQYQEQVGALTVAKGFDPANTGDLAGSALGFKDYRKFGDQAAEQATGDVNSALSILGRGKGEAPVNARNLSSLASASVSEDELQGVFKNLNEAATAISVMAESSPGESEVFTRAAIRGLRDFENPLVQQAGITPQTPFFEAAEKLAPIVTAEAKSRGLKTEDVLKESFTDERVSKGLATLLNRGVNGGLIKDRLDFGKQFEGPGPAQEEIRRFQTDSEGAGPDRIAEAKRRLSLLERGSQTSILETYRKEAEARLQDPKQPGGPRIDTTATGVGDFFGRILTLGQEDVRQRRIDDEARKILLGRAREQGTELDPKVFTENLGGIGQESLDIRFGEVARALPQFGVNPIADVAPGQRAGAVVDRTAELIEALKANTEATNRVAQQGGQQQAPGQRPLPPPLGQRPAPRGQPLRP